MNILAIDTSTKNFSLAVAKDGKVVKYSNTRLKRPLSSSIIPSINRILNAAGLSIDKLDGFAVGLGPGSFTSLRVGLSTVKGLAFTLNKPVIGLSSLDILAMNIEEVEATICTLGDAKRKMVYAGIFHKSNGSIKRKGEYRLDDVDQILKGLKGQVVFIGDGADLYKKNILAKKGIRPVFTDERKSYPQAKRLAEYACQKGINTVNNADQIVPLYLYPEHCQVQNHAKKKV